MTSDGSIVRPRKLYRCAALTKTSALERLRLTGFYDVTCVIDLRSRFERNRTPEPALPGVRPLQAPLVPARALGITLKDDNWRELIRGDWGPDTYDACALYRSFASPQVIDSWKAIFHALLNARGHAVLWHCTNGKDRTGVVAATILRTLGVPDKDIRADYLLSNQGLESERKRIRTVAKLRENEPGVEKKLGALLEARAEYLNAFFDAIDENFGSFEAFLEDACGIGFAEDDELRHLYLQ